MNRLVFYDTARKRQLVRTISISLFIIMAFVSFSSVITARAEEYADANPPAYDVQNSSTNPFIPDIEYHTEPLVDSDSGTYSDEAPSVSVMALPSAYSSYDEGYVSATKHQGSDPTCWLFASNAALETTINKKGLASDVLISEEQYKVSSLTYLGNGTEENPFGKRRYYDSSRFGAGGNFEDYLNHVMCGVTLVEPSTKYPSGYRAGPLDCTTGTFKMGDPLPSLGEALVQPDYNITKTHWILEKTTLQLNDWTGPTAEEKAVLRNRIKQAVYDYGSVYTSMCSETINDSHFVCITDTRDGSYYIDHAVIIVGWDDSVDKSYFYPDTPSINGAFLCKNSWGTWRDPDAYPGFTSEIDWPGGYFWLSYDDIFCGSTTAAICDADRADPNQVTYLTYQNNSIISSNSYSTLVTTPNIYAVKYETMYPSERLDSISFISTNAGTEFELYLMTTDQYTTDSEEILENNEFLILANGVTDNCGIYTVDLPDDVSELIINHPTYYIGIAMSNYYAAAWPTEYDAEADDRAFSFDYYDGWTNSRYIPYIITRTVNLETSDSIPVFVATGKPDELDVTFTLETDQTKSDTIVYSNNGRLNCLTGLGDGEKADISISRKGYLSASLNGYTAGVSCLPAPITLYAGDANCDGIINLFDISKLVQYNSKKVDPADTVNYELYGHMDYNSDGYINLFDISIAIKSMEMIYADVANN